MNLAQLVEDHVSSFGDYESVYFEGVWYTTGQTTARARLFGAGLQGIGVEPGDRVAVMLPNTPEVMITYWATWRVGAAVTPIIFLLPPPEVHRILADSEAKVVVTSPELLPTIEAASEGVDTIEKVVVVGDEVADGSVRFTDLERDGNSQMVDRDANDMAALLYTGGTTGTSKGVMLSHNNLRWMADASVVASQITEGDKTAMVLPLSHGFGLGVAVIGSLIKGQGAMLRWFDSAQTCDLIEKFSLNRMTAVPTMLQMMLAMPLEERDLSSLEVVVSGAAPLPGEVKRAFEARVPSCTILQGYGLSETSPTISVQRISDAREGTALTGSVGRPLPGLDVRIVSEESDEAVAPDEVGEITVRGPNVMLGYWRNPEATGNAIRDEYFHTGDMGKLDTEGNLWIVDRKKDLIIRGGMNVYPADVESSLLGCPGVSEAAVVGRASDKYGEEPIAFVVLEPDATPEDVDAYASVNLAKYKRPVEVRPVLAIPKTPVGKIDKKELRAQI